MFLSCSWFSILNDILLGQFPFAYISILNKLKFEFTSLSKVQIGINTKLEENFALIVLKIFLKLMHLEITMKASNCETQN